MCTRALRTTPHSSGAEKYEHSELAEEGAEKPLHETDVCLFWNSQGRFFIPQNRNSRGQ